MKNIVLIGFMGTGKSTIASQLSQIYQMEVLEMDQEIVSREKLSIPEIFEKYGEEYFRNLETELLIELQGRGNTIISCGGGTPLRECNVREMKKNGLVFWLTADASTIWERIKEDENRPLLKGNMNVEYIQEMMQKRQEKYLSASDFIIKTDGKDVFEICEEIQKKIEGGEKDV